MKTRKTPLFLMLALASVLSGCANTAYRERYQDTVKIEVGNPNVGVSPQTTGVFLDEDGNKVRVKALSRSFLALLDEFAYKAGFSYTVLSDLSHLRVTISETDKHGALVQKKYEDHEAFLNDLTGIANKQLETRRAPYQLTYHWRSDGPEFALLDIKTAKYVCYNLDDRDPAYKSGEIPEQNCQKMSFKKIFLRNVSSAEANTALKELFPEEIGEGVEKAHVAEYKAQNALLIRGKDKQVYDRIAKLLPALDADFNQVIVETKVFQYDDSIGQKLGTKLEYLNGKFTLTSPFSEGTSAQLPNLLYQHTSADGRSRVLAQLAMEDKDGLVRILAEPRLVLQSGALASVKLETKKYFLTTGVNVAGDLRELPSGIDFTVTPTVLGDHKIKLDLVIKQSEFAINNEAGVAATTNANEIKTSIVAQDGELISLGGILTRKDADQSSGMTGLRKVPLLGKLFGSEATSSSISRIEFLIRSTISRSHVRNREFVKAANDTNCMIDTRLGGKGCVAATELEGETIK